jgi:L,D-peptidoglycan transpeptidase YkuD (ErfK/YbiS/YcfS/YnhG family)
MELKEMSIEQLEELQRDLHLQMKEIRTRKRIVSVALQTRAMEAEAVRKVTAMSEPERAVLAKVIGAAGIAPTSAVGTPGAQG